MTEIPFFDDAAEFATDREFIKAQVFEAGRSNDFILKSKVDRLEETIKRRLGAEAAVATSNASMALTLGLRVLGVERDDEVITTPLAHPAALGAILQVGARPILADVDPGTGTIDPRRVEEQVSARTRAILAVHLPAAMADMPSLKAIARRLNIGLLEDAAVCLGARMDGLPAGLWGDVGVYSFWRRKIIGGIGEGGILVTNDVPFADRARMLRNHGQDGVTRFKHYYLGYNARMDEAVAGYLLHRFTMLDSLVRRRAEIADRYTARLARLRPEVAPPPPQTGRVFYGYPILAERRDDLRRALAGRGIETRIQYPTLHLQPAFATLGYRHGDFPVAERMAKRLVSLPFYPRLSDDRVDAAADEVVRFYEASRPRVLPPHPDLLPWGELYESTRMAFKAGI
jgi:dTDP-4-amino-4,6-dideoxygalactose transaminase